MLIRGRGIIMHSPKPVEQRVRGLGFRVRGNPQYLAVVFLDPLARRHYAQNPKLSQPIHEFGPQQ